MSDATDFSIEGRVYILIEFFAKEAGTLLVKPGELFRHASRGDS